MQNCITRGTCGDEQNLIEQLINTIRPQVNAQAGADYKGQFFTGNQAHYPQLTYKSQTSTTKTTKWY